MLSPPKRPSVCHYCHCAFSFFKRHIVCGLCFQAFCSKCADYSVTLPPAYGKAEPVRVCDKCNFVLGPVSNLLFPFSIVTNNRAVHMAAAVSSAEDRQQWISSARAALASGAAAKAPYEPREGVVLTLSAEDELRQPGWLRVKDGAVELSAMVAERALPLRDARFRLHFPVSQLQSPEALR